MSLQAGLPHGSSKRLPQTEAVKDAFHKIADVRDGLRSPF